MPFLRAALLKKKQAEKIQEEILQKEEQELEIISQTPEVSDEELNEIDIGILHKAIDEKIEDFVQESEPELQKVEIPEAEPEITLEEPIAEAKEAEPEIEAAEVETELEEPLMEIAEAESLPELEEPEPEITLEEPVAEAEEAEPEIEVAEVEPELEEPLMETAEAESLPEIEEPEPEITLEEPTAEAEEPKAEIQVEEPLVEAEESEPEIAEREAEDSDENSEPEPEEFQLMYDVTSGERYVDKVSTKTEFDKMLDELAEISKDLLSWQVEKFAKEYTGKFQGDFEKSESDAKKYEAFLGGYIMNAAMILYDNSYREAAIKKLEQTKSILEARKKLEDETTAIKARVEEEDATVDLSDILGLFGDG